MVAWNDSTTLADSESLTGGEAVTADVTGYHTPVVCVVLEMLSGTDDDVTIDFDGDAGTYEADSRTLSETGSYTVDLPQCESVSVTSTNGETYSIEVRNNPR